MTVADLIKVLKKMPQNDHVYFSSMSDNYVCDQIDFVESAYQDDKDAHCVFLKRNYRIG